MAEVKTVKEQILEYCDDWLKKLSKYEFSFRKGIVQAIRNKVESVNEDEWLEEHDKQIRNDAIDEFAGNVIEEIEEIKKWYIETYKEIYDVQICIVLDDLNGLIKQLKGEEAIEQQDLDELLKFSDANLCGELLKIGRWKKMKEKDRNAIECSSYLREYCRSFEHCYDGCVFAAEKYDGGCCLDDLPEKYDLEWMKDENND